MHKYSKHHSNNLWRNIRRKDRRASLVPIEYKIMRITSISLVAFLVAFLSSSVLAPVEITDASSEVLLANQATGGSVSLTTSGNISVWSLVLLVLFVPR